MNARILLATLTALALSAGRAEPAEPSGDIRELRLRDWQPRSMMVTKTTVVEKPRFPVVDVHNHLGGGQARPTPTAGRWSSTRPTRRRSSRRWTASTSAGTS